MQIKLPTSKFNFQIGNGGSRLLEIGFGPSLEIKQPHQYKVQEQRKPKKVCWGNNITDMSKLKVCWGNSVAGLRR
jgi:hypothetical protein